MDESQVVEDSAYRLQRPLTVQSHARILKDRLGVATPRFVHRLYNHAHQHGLSKARALFWIVATSSRRCYLIANTTGSHAHFTVLRLPHLQ